MPCRALIDLVPKSPRISVAGRRWWWSAPTDPPPPPAGGGQPPIGPGHGVSGAQPLPYASAASLRNGREEMADEGGATAAAMEWAAAEIMDREALSLAGEPWPPAALMWRQVMGGGAGPASSPWLIAEQ